MKKIFVIFFISLICTELYAQDRPVQSKFKLGIYFSPEYSSMNRSMREGDNNVSQDFLNTWNRRTSGALGYSTSILTMYSLNKNIEIATGIGFSKWSEQHKDETYYINSPSYEAKISQYYFEIPLKVSFLIGSKKLKFITSTEIAYNVNSFFRENLSDEYATYYNVTDNNKLVTENQFLPGVRFGFSSGIDYELAAKLHLRIEPQIKYYALLWKNRPINLSTWVVGVNLGLTKSF